MGDAYTPGLTVSHLVHISKVRELPLIGSVLASLGAYVSANDPVLMAELPGDLDIIRVADRMGLDHDVVKNCMKVSVGDTISKGQIICEARTFFGLINQTFISPVSGVVEFFTEINSHLGIRRAPRPLQMNAYLSGVVTEVVEGKSVTIETDAAMIQGIFGIGGESYGTIYPLPISANDVVSKELILKIASESKLAGCILVGGATYTLDALREVANFGVCGIVMGSIDSETLSSYMGYEIGVSVTGDENIPCPIIITEGFGLLPISYRVMKLAESFLGCYASINGATQIRAGAMRPEVIIFHNENHANIKNDGQIAKQPSLVLSVGSKIRIIRVPYFGKIGAVTELPQCPEEVESRAKVRVLRVALDGGDIVTVPRANVELI